MRADYQAVRRPVNRTTRPVSAARGTADHDLLVAIRQRIGNQALQRLVQSEALPPAVLLSARQPLGNQAIQRLVQSGRAGWLNHRDDQPGDAAIDRERSSSARAIGPALQPGADRSTTGDRGTTVFDRPSPEVEPPDPTTIPAAAEGLVQRAIGFEFQTNWGVIEKKGRRRKKFHKGEILHAYQGFNLTADEAGTELGAEMEWVVDPPIPESAGPNVLDGIMQRLQNVAGQYVALQGQQRFTADRATGDARDSFIEVQPQIKGPAYAQNMVSNPQVTGGVRLEQMATMFAELGNPQAGGHHQQARQELMGMGGAGLIGNAAAQANTILGSDRLKGLAAQLIAYMRAGALLGVPGGFGQAYNYAKLIGKIMARTDFASQFRLLPDDERTRFEQDPRAFATLILNAAGLPGNVSVFERQIKVDPADPTKGTFDFPVTRLDWLVGIAEGKDKLSSFHMPHWKPELEGLGALGGKTDVVGLNRAKGVVLEFRQVSPQMPYTQWRDFANRVFAYLIDLNRRQSPDEQT